MLNWIEINKKALIHNFEAFLKVTGKSRLGLVLKSNAYGHGLPEIYKALSEHHSNELFTGCYLITNYFSEAKELRDLGFSGKLLIVGPIPSENLQEYYQKCEKEKIEVTIGNHESLTAWLSSVKKPKVHIKFDTGMSRQGFFTEEAEKVVAMIASNKNNIVGICTHFANVEDVLEHDYADQQLKKFGEAYQAFHDAGIEVLRHSASSASCLLLEESRFDLCRVGISLYGMWPSKATRLSFLQKFNQVLELLPVLSWKTHITTIKVVKSGQFIGYGCTVRANQDMKIAVLPIGYFEGFPRLASDARSYVLIQGSRCQIVGRICMNMMMVDVSHLSNTKVGNIVTLIGTDGSEYISANDLAGWAQTINYELLSRLHPSISRVLT